MSEQTSRVDHAELGTPALRYDAGRLGKVERTPSGGVRIPASLARTGVLTYRDADGSTRREYRPAEEVFHADALRSYEDAAVTIGHPTTGKVTPDTFRRDSVGHVRGAARREGDLVAGELAVQDAAAIGRIDAGELVELSAGYDVLYEATPGTTPMGERYDGIQRRIRVNHVALLPAGGGRSGREVALRLDAAAIEIENASTPTRTAPAPTTRTDSMKTQRIDGIEYEVGTAAWAQACERRDAKVAEQLAALEARAKGAEAKVAEQTARADAAERRVRELEAELAPARLDARVAERVALVERVRPVLGSETKLDGKSEVEIMTLAISKLDPSFKLDAIAEAQRETYVRARFDSEMRHVPAARTPLERSREDALPPIPSLPGGPPQATSVADLMRQMEHAPAKN